MKTPPKEREVSVTAVRFTHVQGDAADGFWVGVEEGSSRASAHPPASLGQTCSGASLL